MPTSTRNVRRARGLRDREGGPVRRRAGAGLRAARRSGTRRGLRRLDAARARHAAARPAAAAVQPVEADLVALPHVRRARAGRYGCGRTSRSGSRARCRAGSRTPRGAGSSAAGLYGGGVHEGVGDAGPSRSRCTPPSGATPRPAARGTSGSACSGAGSMASRTRPGSLPARRARSRPGLDAAAGALEDARALVGANLELAAVRGPVSIQAELTALAVDRPGGPDPLPVGGYAFATWTLTGESRSYRAESSDFARLEIASPVGASGGRGAWELGAADRRARPGRGGRGTAPTVRRRQASC